MRKFMMLSVPLLLMAAMAVAQMSQSSSDQSTTDKAKGAASATGNTIKQGAETGYNKTKEGAGKAYNKTKNAVTGSSNEQTNTSEPNQAGTGENTTTSRNLPQTASPLPLIGLLGLGMFSLGAWRTRWLRR